MADDPYRDAQAAAGATSQQILAAALGDYEAVSALAEAVNAAQKARDVLEARGVVRPDATSLLVGMLAVHISGIEA